MCTRRRVIVCFADVAPSPRWEQVGKGQKKSVARFCASLGASTPISALFRGLMHSSVSAPGKKPSVTVEPYHCLSLDVDSPGVGSVEDALVLFSEPEMLEDYRASPQVRVRPRALRDRAPGTQNARRRLVLAERKQTGTMRRGGREAGAGHSSAQLSARSLAPLKHAARSEQVLLAAGQGRAREQAGHAAGAAARARRAAQALPLQQRQARARPTLTFSRLRGRGQQALLTLDPDWQVAED